MRLTQERLREVLHYDPLTGVWTWIVRKAHNKAHKGARAGRVSNQGYRQICIDGEMFLGHRLAFFWMEGEMPPEEVDHINMDRADDRWANLRKASRVQNFGNQRVYRNNKLGVKGVCRRGKKYHAQIQHNKKKICLGYFTTLEEASEAYRMAAVERFGEYHRTG